MAQSIDLLVKVQDAEAKVKVNELQNKIRQAQQVAEQGIQLVSSNAVENAEKLNTVTTKYIDAEKRLITLKQQEYVVQEEIRDEEGKITQERQTAIRDTKTISTNYAQIAKELSRMEAESAKITAETERLAQNAERAKAAFAKSLTGKTRENYQNGGYSAEFASEVQSATTVAWQQYSASLTEAYQKQSQLNAETSMFGQISDSAFAQYSSGAMSAAVAQRDIKTSQEQSVEAIAHGIVIAQQFFDTMNGVGRQCGVTADEVSVFAELSDNAFRRYANGAMSASEANKTLNNSEKQVTEETKKTRGEFTLLHTVLLRLAHTALSAVTRAFREALTEMKNVDSALVVVRKVSDASSDELLALKERAYEVGAAYGVLASDYLNAAAEMTRAGYREQAGDLAELATKLQLVGDVSQDVANQFLIATDKSYKMNGNYQKLSETIDKLNEIDNNFATSFEKVADGIGLLAPVAAQANVSFDEMAAAIGTVTAVTQRSGTEAARALRSLFINILKDTTTEIDEGVTWTVDEINSLSDALKKYAPEVVRAAEATGDLINPMEALGALAQSYKDGLLTNQDLFEITSGLGGKLRTSQLLALIQNWDMYNQMLDKTADAAGSADKEVSNALDSWQVKLNQLKNTFTDFVQKGLSTDFIKGLLDSVKWLIKGFGDFGTVIRIVGGALVALAIPKVITWFKNLGAALTATTFSATAFKAAVAGITIVITAVIFAINKYNESLKELDRQEEEFRKKSIETAKSAISEINEIKSLKDNYDNLKKAFEDGTGSREDYKLAQDAIIQKLKDEGVWAGSAKSGYDELTASIEKSTAAALENRKAELYGGFTAARKEARHHLVSSLDDSRNGRRVGVSKTYNPYLYGKRANEWTGTDEYGKATYSVALDYERALAYRNSLYSLGKTSGDEWDRVNKRIADSQQYVEAYYEIVDEYLSLLSDSEKQELRNDPEWDFLLSRYEYLHKDTEEVVSDVDDTAKSFKSLSDELKSATNALDAYNKKLKESGEKGDAFKSYAEAYKKAVEMYEKGLTGSNQYMSAVDLLFGEVDDYEEAGKLLGNAFVKAMFEGGGDDYGANAANYIKNHIDEFEGVQITEGENGTFGLMVTDMDKFAESTGLTTDALWTLIDALDIFDSKTTYTNEQLYNLIGDDKLVNLTELINELASQGKSAKQIKDIIEAIKGLAESDGEIKIEEPEDLDQTIKDIIELNKEAEKDKDMEVVLTSNSEEFFDGIYRQIDQLDGTTIYVGLKLKGNGSTSGAGTGLTFSGGGGGHYSYASGTNSSRGGLSLVNEEGAELIYANGKAWIAGGGDPTITNLPIGAGVFNARQTREILSRSGIASNNGAYVGGLGGSGFGSGAHGSAKLTENLLKQIAEYINDILKKAKEALQEQLDAIDEQIDKLKREHDAEEDANKLEELRLKILEAEKKLAEAENERTVRYFNKETGQWEWMADQKAVAEAQKALQDARDAYNKEVEEQAYQAQLQALQDQKDALNDAYNKLADDWDTIYQELEDILNAKGTVDIAKLLQQLVGTKGGGYAPDIKTLLEAIGAFTSDPTSVLDAATTARIMSLSGTTGGENSVLSALFGTGSYDLNGRAQSTLGGNTSIVGDTIYYINGVQIGSDMMNKPLSQILSVLPIYAN